MKKKSPRSRRRRMPLSCKYRWRGMSKTNYRKHNKRLRYLVDEIEYS